MKMNKPKPQVHLCECGKRMSKFSTKCKSCYEKEEKERLDAADIIVKKGICPDCGSILLRNSSMTGWYQCALYAAPDFRLPALKNDPRKCNFQITARS